MGVPQTRRAAARLRADKEKLLRRRKACFSRADGIETEVGAGLSEPGWGGSCALSKEKKFSKKNFVEKRPVRLTGLRDSSGECTSVASTQAAQGWYRKPCRVSAWYNKALTPLQTMASAPGAVGALASETRCHELLVGL